MSKGRNIAAGTFDNGVNALNTTKIFEVVEAVNITASAPNTNVDLDTGAIFYYTANTTADFTLNFRANTTVALNTFLAVNQSITASILVTNGATAYRPTVFQIDGTAVTPKWAGGIAPSTGNINSIDIYTFTIIKTANNTYTVLASQTKYA